MSKRATTFVCQVCGAEAPKWVGCCPACEAWNSMVEERIEAPAPSGSDRRAPRGRGESKPRPYGEVGLEDRARILTSIPGFDSVLGGGAVPGSLVLVAGEPGAGKSTLMLQAAAAVAAAGPVLLVTGEESEAQVRLRGERLGIKPGGLHVFCETDLDRIISAFEELGPKMMVVDSVQTVYDGRFSSAPGSVTQVRETAAQLLMLAKGGSVPIFIVGHVTKEGLIAGPKTMEHIVDTVVMLEGERFHSLRILRALKNRFGPVTEMAVFEMGPAGLSEVPNPSELFLAERPLGVSGSAVTATVKGTRPLLIEVQALVSPTVFGSGRRTAEGFDQNRLALLLAVLEQRAGLDTRSSDVYLNVVGGMRLDEPGADLGVAAAVASALLNKPLPEGAVFVGELGLGGEVRSVGAAELRCKEAAALGLKELYLPARDARKLEGAQVGLHALKTVGQLIEILFY